METLADWFPPLGLKVTAGPVELRPILDGDLPALCQLAADGVHEPERMPFFFPWTDGTPEEVGRRVAQYQWRKRAEFTREAWTVNFAVWYDGEVVGTQGIETESFLVTRTGETGSWLGIKHHGRGIGTRMRQAICALAFDHLDFEQVTSGAFLDNPASLAVSRKVGYRDNGIRRLKRRDEMAENRMLVLSPEDFVRGEPIEVEGVAAFRRFIGLDPA
jgi:RimJ/RimL family protein N-acetyltransferase